MYHNSSKYYVGSTIIEEARKVVKEALFEEICKLFLEKNPHFGEQEWSDLYSYITSEDTDNNDRRDNDPEGHYETVDITASADMGWQK